MIYSIVFLFSELVVPHCCVEAQCNHQGPKLVIDAVNFATVSRFIEKKYWMN